MIRQVILVDGHIDEPSCLGVPPYISPHIRYLYGALLMGGVREENIIYLTAEEARQQLPAGDWLIVLGGTTVPGKYLGGQPLSRKEMQKMANNNPTPEKWLLGPIVEAGIRPGGFNHYVGEGVAHQVLDKLQGTGGFSRDLLQGMALRGASLIPRHPRFPYVVAELETYRGCRRPSQCFFCSERWRKLRYIRQAEEVAAEVEELYRQGGRYFRLGSQPDLLNYDDGQPNTLERLYTGIRAAAPDLKVLHLDNVEPGRLIRSPEGPHLLKIIVQHNTPGDIASFGLESADPQVIEANNIAVSPAECKKAVELVNEIGGVRKNGLPALLPGLNFLHGLQGERRETVEINLDFLRKLVQKGLLLRRINIRQVIPHGNYRKQPVARGAFDQYKEQVNREINRPLLQKVFPRGLIFQEVIPEKIQGNLTFGRPLGTYPVRIGLPGKKELFRPLQVKIIEHGYRSLTGLQYPFNLNRASHEELLALPGIGQKRAAELILQRPFRGPEDLKNRLGNEVAEIMEEYIDCYQEVRK